MPRHDMYVNSILNERYEIIILMYIEPLFVPYNANIKGILNLS
jgi:hypothetical protein